ncbi:MAG: acetylxylan esterase [Armatimonadetes bacterium]|nr:acetylxylan esterase [Candidatus Hippobium faecium]
MPLLFDMPMEECEKYMGINPKPIDFDEYWDSSIAEMKAIDTEIEFVPAVWNYRNVEAYDIWFTGVGGARIHGKCVKPLNADKPAPTVLMFHGYSGAGDDFPSLISWAAQGYAAFSLDARGQAGFSEDKGGVQGNTLNGQIIRGLDDDDPKKLLFRAIFLDCAQLAHLAMKLDFVDENNVFCMGGSQGGGLSTACAALEPRIKKASITFPFLSDYKRIWKIDLYKDAYQELSWYFRTRDPHHEREEEIWTKLGYIDVHNLAPRIKAEVLMNTGCMDTVCPPSTQFAVYNNITSKKRHHFWYDYGHEGLPNEWNEISDFFAEGLDK